MFRAIRRKAWADLRSQPLRTALILMVVFGAAFTLMTAFTVRRTAADPFERVHDQANGAHVWFEETSGGLEAIATMSGVESATDEFLQVRGTLVGSLSPVGLKYWPVGPEGGQIAPALLLEGRWPAAGSNEVVIDTRLARHAGADIGDTIEASSASAATKLEVVGIGALTASSPVVAADAAEPVPVFVSPETVLLLAGGSVEEASQDDLFLRRVNHAIGVRLDDPAAAASFTSQVEAQTGAVGLTWITVANDIGRETEGAVLIFSIFTVFAIAVAAFVIANAVAASVLSRTKEIGVLKAVGMTPRQVTTVFLVQNLALAVVAAAIGASAGQLAAPLFVEEVADLLNTSAPVAFEPGLMLTTMALITAFVLLVTWLPAWRAGRMSAVSAIGGGARLRPRRSRLAALASRMRAPQVVAYGIKDAFTRPARTWLNVATVAVAAAAVMFTLTFDATISNAAGSPVQYGYAPSEVKIIPLPAFGSLRASGTVGGQGVADPISKEELIALVESRREVESFVTWRNMHGAELVGQHAATAPNRGPFRDTVTVTVVGGPIEEFQFHIEDGRFFAAPEELIVDLKLARRHGIEVGDRLELFMRDRSGVEFATPEMVVVGTYAARPGGSIVVGLDTLRAIDPQADAGSSLEVKLSPGIDRDDFAREFVAVTGGRVLVDDNSGGFDEDIAENREAIPVLLGLNTVLIALAAVNLFGTLAVSIRERTREFGIMKAIGFSPRQIVRSVVSAATLMTAVGVIIGASVGFLSAWRLFLSLAQDDGVPSDFVQFPSLPWLALFIPITALIAVLAAALPARRAAALPVADALRYE